MHVGVLCRPLTQNTALAMCSPDVDVARTAARNMLRRGASHHPALAARLLQRLLPPCASAADGATAGPRKAQTPPSQQLVLNLSDVTTHVLFVHVCARLLGVTPPAMRAVDAHVGVCRLWTPAPPSASTATDVDATARQLYFSHLVRYAATTMMMGPGGLSGSAGRCDRRWRVLVLMWLVLTWGLFSALQGDVLGAPKGLHG